LKERDRANQKTGTMSGPRRLKGKPEESGETKTAAFSRKIHDRVGKNHFNFKPSQKGRKKKKKGKKGQKVFISEIAAKRRNTSVERAQKAGVPRPGGQRRSKKNEHIRAC